MMTDASDLYQSDMKLTDAQYSALLTSNRKGVADAFYLWPEDTDGYPLVHYQFADGNKPK